jgi:hypothetical protein
MKIIYNYDAAARQICERAIQTFMRIQRTTNRGPTTRADAEKILARFAVNYLGKFPVGVRPHRAYDGDSPFITLDPLA